MSKKCLVEGCNCNVHAKGYCKMHYNRFVRHGDPEHVEKESHGMSYTPEYTAWANMKDRCYNKNSEHYKNYGGRNITVCERWRDSFINFFDDMGKKPKRGMQIDRIDNNGNYEPSNCHWATHTDNQRNKSDTILTMEKAREIRDKYAKGVRNCDLAKEYGCFQSTISQVIHNRIWKKFM